MKNLVLLSQSPVFNHCLYYFHCFLMLFSLLSSFTRSSWNEITGLPIPKTPYYSSNISLHDYKACPHPLLSFILSHWLAMISFTFLICLINQCIQDSLSLCFHFMVSLSFHQYPLKPSCPELCPLTTATERHCNFFFYLMMPLQKQSMLFYFSLVYLLLS